MKIENETQAKAARKYIEADCEMFNALGSWIGIVPISELKAALAAYESRDKVKEIAEGLSENAKIVLAWAELSYGATMDAIGECKRLGLVFGGETNKYAVSQETLGKEVAAYLRAQKRELNWEVWYSGHENYTEESCFICACSDKQTANDIRRYRARSLAIEVGAYEVREVK